jgi:hypothetical protein
MQKLTLLTLILLGVSGRCLAADKPTQNDQLNAEESQTMAWNGVIHPDGSGMPGVKVKQDDHDLYCFKMRSYLVKQEAPGSDAVVPAGYRTCLPSSHIEMRTSEMRENNSPHGSGDTKH